MDDYVSANGAYPTGADGFRCDVSENVSLYYLALGPEEYQLVSYHNQGRKAFLLSSNEEEVKENSLEEIKKQLANSFGPSVVGPDFHFVN